MLKKLCFKPSISKTFSMIEEELLPIESCLLILSFSLSPNVAYPHFLLVMKANFDSSTVMCLEYSLSKNHFSFFDSYNRKSRNFRYPSLFRSLVVNNL